MHRESAGVEGPTANGRVGTVGGERSLQVRANNVISVSYEIGIPSERKCSVYRVQKNGGINNCTDKNCTAKI